MREREGEGGIGRDSERATEWAKAEAWCLLIHADASLSLSLSGGGVRRAGGGGGRADVCGGGGGDVRMCVLGGGREVMLERQ